MRKRMNTEELATVTDNWTIVDFGRERKPLLSILQLAATRPSIEVMSTRALQALSLAVKEN
jgi:hypothetical protein